MHARQNSPSEISITGGTGARARTEALRVMAWPAVPSELDDQAVPSPSVDEMRPFHAHAVHPDCVSWMRARGVGAVVAGSSQQPRHVRKSV